MPTISLCADYSSRFLFGGPYLETDGKTRYAGEAAIDVLAELVGGRRTLLLLPGFNNSANNAQASFDTIGENLAARGLLGPRCPYEIAIGVLWPGRTVTGYSLAEQSARKSADKLRELVGKLRPQSLSIEAHSLGNLVALHANRDGGLNLDSLVLCNAAVDDESVEREQAYFPAVDSIRGKCLIIYSRHDEVLGGAYRWLGSVPRNLLAWLGHKTGGWGDQALGFSGPEHGEKLISPTTIPVNATAWCPNHGAARKANEFYAAWQQIVT